MGVENKGEMVVDPFTGLEVMREQKGDREFKLYAGPELPPKDMDKLDTFPVEKVESADIKREELKVLRVHPRGEVGNIGAITVAFNQAMIPLTGIGEERAINPPVRIEPKVNGNYKWLGTRLLSFEPGGRFPYSTRYRVTIPAGVKSALGKEKATEEYFTFSTPTVKVDNYSPGRYGHHSTLVPLAFRYNQDVDADHILSKSRLVSSDGERIGLRLAGRSEYRKYMKYASFIEGEKHKSRVVVMVPVKELMRNMSYTYTLEAGVQSKEGPVTTAKKWVTSFRTYGPMSPRGTGCGWNFGKCRPGWSPRIEFTNQIKSSDKEISRLLKITPAVKDLKVRVSHNSIYLYGEFKAARKYRAVLRGGIGDVWGQSYLRKYSGEIEMDDAHPQLNLPAYRYGVIEKTKNTKFTVSAINNMEKARITMIRVEGEALFGVLGKMRNWYYRYYKPEAPSKGVKGKKVVYEVKLNRRKNELEEYSIDLRKVLGSGGGVVFLEIYSPSLKINRYYDPYRFILLQVTDTGITAKYDLDRILVMATSLTGGKALKGAQVRIHKRYYDKTSRKYNHKKVWEGKTDANGIAQCPGAKADQSGGPRVVEVIQGKKDSSYILLDGYGRGGSGYVSSYSWWSSSIPKERTLLYQMFSDRNPYRPGDVVQIGGILRSRTRGPKGKVEALEGRELKLKYRITNPRGTEVKKGEVKVDEDGMFRVEYASKVEGKIGYYNFRGEVIGGSNIEGNRYVYYGFQILSYRAPEHEVKVSGGEGPWYHGDRIKSDIRGTYTFGGGMNGAKMSWTLRRQRGWYSPPKNPGYQFGVPVYWGGWGYWGSYNNYSRIIKSGNGQLDREGNAHVENVLDPGKGKDALPGVGLFTFESEVTDVNRQSIAGRYSITSHPSNYYVGLKTPGGIVRVNKEFKVRSVVVDIDGERQSGVDIEIRAVRTEWERKMVKKGKYYESQWSSKVVEKGKCKVKSNHDPVECRFKMKEGGSYTIEGVVSDKKGRKAKSHASIWVYGGKQKNWRQKNNRQVEILLDKKVYEPGEEAQILFKLPFGKSRGIITYEREGILSHKVVEFKGSSHLEKFLVTEEMLPNVNIGIVIVRGRERMQSTEDDSDPGRPMYASGSSNISISRKSREINVMIIPSKKKILPGEEIEVEVQTTDKNGKGVESRVVMSVVDEGVLTLLGYRLPNPLDAFLPWRGSETSFSDIRVDLLKDPKKKLRPRKNYSRYRNADKQRISVLDGVKSSPARVMANAEEYDAPVSATIATGALMKKEMRKGSGEASGGGKGGLVFKVRKNFATTAYFTTEIRTDSNGKGKVRIKMPENLTSYRFMAMAMENKSGKRYGSGDEKIRVVRNFMIRPSLPRFANYGDEFDASVVVNNMTGKGGEARIKIEGTGFKLLDSSDEKRVKIESNSSSEVYFRVKTLWPGKARFRFSGYMGQETDSVEPPPLEVHVPVSSEATATYGSTEKGVIQPVQAPGKIMKNFGGLDIHLSSSALTGLQDAVIKLMDHEYDCAESIASRLIPLITLKDILTDFHIAKIGSIEKQKRMGQRLINKLIGHQNYEGGFSYWPGHYYVSPYVSVFSTWVLYMAKLQGYSVPQSVLNKASRYMMRLIRDSYYLRRWRRYTYYSWTTKFFAYWVLTQLRQHKWLDSYANDKSLRRYTKDFYSNRNRAGLFGKAWLMSSLYRMDGNSSEVKELMREIQNTAVESARGMHFAESTSEDLRLLMHSNSMTDSIVMRSIMEVSPKDVIIPKVMRSLMESRIKGSWESSLANSFALESVSYYYHKYESIPPDFKVMIWLGKGYVGTKKFKGRSMQITHKHIPMSYLARSGKTDLLMSRKGSGRLYYRLGMSYVPSNLKLPAEERGFSVIRKYEAIEEKDSVVLKTDGSYEIKAGKYVRVRLTVIVPDRKYYAVIDDPFPGGFEGVDMQLRTSASSRLSEKTGHSGSNMGYYWSWYWWRNPDHKELRDDRYVLFYDRLPAGVYEHSYVVRATTPGTFVVPPLKAHEMYAPESFGRNASTIVKIVR